MRTLIHSLEYFVVLECEESSFYVMVLHIYIT
jgi:hypothetical protein